MSGKESAPPSGTGADQAKDVLGAGAAANAASPLAGGNEGTAPGHAGPAPPGDKDPDKTNRESADGKPSANALGVTANDVPRGDDYGNGGRSGTAGDGKSNYAVLYTSRGDWNTILLVYYVRCFQY